MLRSFHNNMAVFAVALVACSLAWVYGGTMSGPLVKFAPWLCALLLEVMLCFPQMEEGETNLYKIRERLWVKMQRDPVVWTVAVFMFIMVFAFGNRALCPNCDAAAIANGAKAGAPVPFMPFCVDWWDHFSVCMWFLPALLALLAVRHSLVSEGKILCLKILVWNGVLLAAVGILQQITGADGPLWCSLPDGARPVYFFSTFGYPNMGADYFAVLFAVSLALWRHRITEVDADLELTEGKSTRSRHQLFWDRHVYLIPAVILFYSTMNTLSRAGIILASVSGAIIIIHAAVCFLHRMHRVERVKAAALWFMVLIVIAVSASIFTPDSVKNELNSVSTIGTLDRMAGKGEYHARTALELWKDHPIFGCGGWGYKHLCSTKMPQSFRDELKRGIPMTGAANVHNDYLQFLCEHGIVGLGCLVLIVLLALRPVAGSWKKLSKAARFADSRHRPPPPRQLFALPAPAFSLLIALLITAIHAVADCPMRSPAVLTLFFIIMASVDAFLPTSLDEAEKTINAEYRDSHHHHHHHHHQEAAGGGEVVNK